MPKKTFTPEQIVAKLRQVEVLISQGKTVPLACKEAGIVDQTYYRWRREFGGLQLEQAKKLKDLQKENAQLPWPTHRNHVWSYDFMDAHPKLKTALNDVEPSVVLAAAHSLFVLGHRDEVYDID